MAKPGSGGGGNGGGAIKTAPKLSNTTTTVDENGVLTVQVVASDPDKNDTLRYSFADGTSVYTAADGLEFSVNPLTGIITSSGALNYEATSSYVLSVKATDKYGLTGVGTITVAVADKNEFAVTTSLDVDVVTNTVQEGTAAGTAVGITASAVDRDGTNNTVSYVLVTDATGSTLLTNGAFQIGASTGIVTVRDGSLIDYESATSQTTYVKATSSDGSSKVQAFTVAVTNKNEAPVAQSLSAQVSEDGPGALIIPAYADPDAGDSHTITLNTTGTLGKVTLNADGTFSYDPNGKFESLGVGSGTHQTVTDTFSYTVDDGHGGSDTKTVTITVRGENDGPSGGVPLLATPNSTTTSTSRPLTQADITNSATQFFNSENGHIFEIVQRAVTWTEAKNELSASAVAGVSGYLVTITDASEQAFVKGIVAAHVPVSSGYHGSVWLGASDAESEGVWKWVTGPEAGTQFWQGGPFGNAVGTAKFWSWHSGNPADENVSGWTNPTGTGSDYLFLSAPLYETSGPWDDAYSSTTAASTASSPVESSDGIRMDYVIEYSGPVISSTTTTTVVLTADASQLSDPEGLGELSFHWQSWNGTAWSDIEGATNETFIDDLTHDVRAKIDYVDGAGTHEVVYSAAYLHDALIL